MKFHVITVTYNMAEWVADCLGSVKRQSDTGFDLVMVDDISTDETVERAVETVAGDDRFRIVVNEEKRYKSRNVFEAIKLADPADEDVIVMLDGDDMLAHEDVLAKLRTIYEDADTWLTYGSYEDSNGVRYKRCKPYPRHVIRKNAFRRTSWCSSHLKTFRYALWRRIRPDAFAVTQQEYRGALMRALLSLRFRRWYHWQDVDIADLHDQSGAFIRRVDDKAFMLPMLEMAGEHAIHLEEVMYIFRVPDATRDVKHQIFGGQGRKKWHTRLIRDVLLHKEPYRQLDSL